MVPKFHCGLPIKICLPAHHAPAVQTLNMTLETHLALYDCYDETHHFTLLFCCAFKEFWSLILAARSRLLALPRELRDRAYGYYFFDKDGYTYDYDTGRLTTSTPNMNRIELDLRFTCYQIAFETRGLPLQLNTIHFSTVYRD